MKFSSFDLKIYTFYKEKLEKMRRENHWSIEQICREIPLSFHTYKKLVSLDPERDISFYNLKKIKRFIEKDF